MKKYIAEVLGTGALTLVVGLSIAGSFPVPTPVLAALTLGLFVYSIGHISGTHINPAVTIGAWSIGKIDRTDAFFYMLAQVFGAGCALLILQATVIMPEISVSNSLRVGFAEAIGTFFFTFGIASVMYKHTPTPVSGLVRGGSLLLGVSFAVLLGANGVLNPAVSFGIGSFSIMYLLGPIIGAVLGMQVYKHLG